MAITTRRKTAAAALVVVGIAGLSIASAAQLNLSSTASLGAGQTVVESCQPAGDPIEVTFENEFETDSYKTTKIELSEVAVACQGLNFKVVVDDTVASEVEGTMDMSAVTSITLTPAVAAEDIEKVSVVIFD